MTPTHALPGDCIAGRFLLEAFIGEGGMGTVFRALDLETDAVVAVKLIIDASPQGLERFERESRMLADLRHPHVVRWIAHGRTDGGDPYLVMEWLEGEDLAERLARGPLGTREAVRLALHVAEGLAAVHALGVVHRDIKPENIFLPHGSVDGVRVLDFGIAKNEQLQTITKTGLALGTVGFMAPEQIVANGRIGPWTDVFSLGCVLYEALTGKLPFSGPHPMAVLLKIMLEDAPRARDVVPSLPAVLDELLVQMLARDIEQRVANAEELLVGLRLIDASELADEPGARPSLTATERRVVSIIVASTDQLPSEDGARKSQMERAARSFGATLETTDAQLVVAILAGEGTPRVQAARAAGCALALRSHLPDAPMVLVTGLDEVSQKRVPIGSLIDRAVVELASASRQGVTIDALSASLVDDRFEVVADERGFVLVSERQALGSARLLLGRPTPCIGRERDIATLTATFDQCVDEETARASLVVGSPGLGKSRVVSEVLRSIALRGAVTCLEGRGDPVTPALTFGILGSALRAAAGIETEPLEARRERIVALVHRSLGDASIQVAPFIGEIAGAPFDDTDDATLRAARDDPRIMASWIDRAFVRWLGAECDAQPVVLVLEDLHWGDSRSLRLVEHAVAQLAERRLMVVATARPEIFDVFAPLKKSRVWNVHALAGLSKRAAQRLVRAVLGDDIDADTVARLVEQADGNPYFLEELVRHTAEGKHDILPTSLIGIVHARLDELDADARRLLRAGSILGATFAPGAVAHLLAAPLVTIAGQLAMLVAKELLTPGDPLAFRHAIVREVAYATLTDDDRRLGHRLAAEWLEGTGAAPAAIASHFELGLEPRRAAAWYERAARAALEANDFDSALRVARRGLACGASGSIGPGVESQLRLVTGRVLRWKLELVPATDELHAAFAALPPGSRDWFVAVGDLLNVISRRHLMTLAREVAGALLTTPCLDDADAPVRAIALSRAAFQHALMERALVDGLLDAAREEVRVLPGHEPYVTAQLRTAEAAEHAINTGFVGRALRAGREAMATYEALGDQAALCNERVNASSSMAQLGLCDELVAHAGPWIDETLTLGLPFPAFVMRYWRARALFELGDRETARRELRLVLAAVGKVPYSNTSHALLSLIALGEGALDEAEGEASAGLALAGPLKSGRAWNLACLARIALARGHDDEARTRADEALRIVEAADAMLNDLSVRRTYIDVHEALGEHEAAEAQRARARAIVHTRVADLDEPSWREAFLALADVRALVSGADVDGRRE